MDTEEETRSVEEILTTIAQLEYRNHKTVEKLSDEVSQMNVLLGRVNRRLWAQNVVAWIQLVALAVAIVVLIVVFIAMMAGLPVAVDWLRIP